MRGRGKDFVRSQGRSRASAGDVLRTGGSLRARLAWCAAPMLCLAVVAASLLGFGAIAHGRLAGTAAHGEVSPAVEEGVQGERASSGEGSTDASARVDDAGEGDAAYGQDSLLGRSGAKRRRALAIPMPRQLLRFLPSWIGFRRIARREKARWRLSFAWTRDLFLRPAPCSRCIRVSEAPACIPVATSTLKEMLGAPSFRLVLAALMWLR